MSGNQLELNIVLRSSEPPYGGPTPWKRRLHDHNDVDADAGPSAGHQQAAVYDDQLYWPRRGAELPCTGNDDNPHAARAALTAAQPAAGVPPSTLYDARGGSLAGRLAWPLRHSSAVPPRPCPGNVPAVVSDPSHVSMYPWWAEVARADWQQQASVRGRATSYFPAAAAAAYRALQLPSPVNDGDLRSAFTAVQGKST